MGLNHRNTYIVVNIDTGITSILDNDEQLQQFL